jgi:hypothetical protein
MSEFELFIGVDYSGAQTLTSRLKGLQVYAARGVPGRYFDPPLTTLERAAARRAGWILRVC